MKLQLIEQLKTNLREKVRHILICCHIMLDIVQYNILLYNIV